MLHLDRPRVPFIRVPVSPGYHNAALDISIEQRNLDTGNHHDTTTGDDRGSASGGGAGLQPPR